MPHLSPLEWVFASAAIVMVVWGLILLCKAITKACAKVWFAEKEKHTRRILKMSKEDHKP